MDSYIVLERSNGRKSLADFTMREHRVADSMHLGRGNASFYKLTLGRAQDQTAGNGQKPGACIVFQLFPELISTQYERDVIRTLPVGLANHSCAAVRRTLIVGRRELLDGQHFCATLGQVLCSSAAHGPQPENDDVVAHADV